MSQHTPGPWTIQERSDDYTNGYFIEADVLGLDICTIATAGHKDNVQTANARLIAKAPKMFTLVRHAARQDVAPDILQKRARALLREIDYA